MPIVGQTTAPPSSPLAARIHQLSVIELRLAKVDELIREIPPAFVPDVLAQIRYILARHDSNARNPPLPDEDASAPDVPVPDELATTVAGRMKQYFIDTGNRPCSAHEIAVGAEVAYETVRSILYKRNRGRFERVGETKDWKLAAAHFESDSDI